MSEERKAEPVPSVTPEDVVQLYKKHNIQVRIATTNLKGSNDYWDDQGFLTRAGVYVRENNDSGCCGLGIILLGSATFKHMRDAAREVGIDYHGFVGGFDGGRGENLEDTAWKDLDVNPDTLNSYRLGRASFKACVEAGLPGTENFR